MLTYSAEALKKAEEAGPRSLGPLEYESAVNLNKYYTDIPIQDHAVPGTNSKFDSRYTLWLKEKSAWVPLGVIRNAPIDDLAKAGYPSSKVEGFRTAFKTMEDDELANPGRATEKPALALVEAARDLGAEVNSSIYPFDSRDGSRGPLQRSRAVLQGTDGLRRGLARLDLQPVDDQLRRAR